MLTSWRRWDGPAPAQPAGAVRAPHINMVKDFHATGGTSGCPSHFLLFLKKPPLAKIPCPPPRRQFAVPLTSLEALDPVGVRAQPSTEPTSAQPCQGQPPLPSPAQARAGRENPPLTHLSMVAEGALCTSPWLLQ